jgi:hypothetical protein
MTEPLYPQNVTPEQKRRLDRAAARTLDYRPTKSSAGKDPAKSAGGKRRLSSTGDQSGVVPSLPPMLIQR